MFRKVINYLHDPKETIKPVKLAIINIPQSHKAQAAGQSQGSLFCQEENVVNIFR